MAPTPLSNPFMITAKTLSLAALSPMISEKSLKFASVVEFQRPDASMDEGKMGVEPATGHSQPGTSTSPLRLAQLHFSI